MSRKETLRAEQLIRLVGYDNASRAYENMAQQHREDQGAHERGSLSEMVVAKALISLSYVESADITQKYSDDDMGGIDIRVLVNKEILDVRFDYLRVQVKSSQSGVRSFKSDIKKRHEFGDEGLQNYLIVERLLIIDGSKSDPEIRNSFESQLYNITPHWRPVRR